MSEDDRCPCGTPRDSAYYWHQLHNHDCIHHEQRMAGCEECFTRRLAAQLVAETEQYLMKVA